MRMMLAVLLLSGCGEAEEDPLVTAWNQIFEIDSYAEGEGCDAPTEVSEPPQPYLGIALGLVDEVEQVYLATSYYCPEENLCEDNPFSNAVLDTVGVDQIAGFFGDLSFDSRRNCLVSWVGITAERPSEDRVILTAQRHVSETEQVDSDSCLAYLDSLYGEACDATVRIEASVVETL